MPKRKRHLYFTAVYSEDDCGWYAEVFDEEGKDVCIIPEQGVLPTKREVVRKALSKVEALEIGEDDAQSTQ